MLHVSRDPPGFESQECIWRHEHSRVECTLCLGKTSCRADLKVAFLARHVTQGIAALHDVSSPTPPYGLSQHDSRSRDQVSHDIADRICTACEEPDSIQSVQHVLLHCPAYGHGMRALCAVTASLPA